jgi:hypothetical protein
MTSRTLRIKSVFILALLLVAAPAATAGQTVSVFRQKGNTATATFLATDPNDSCLINFVSVTGSDLIEKVLAGGGIKVLRPSWTSSFSTPVRTRSCSLAQEAATFPPPSLPRT